MSKLALWPDCCRRLDELEVEVQSLRAHEAKLLQQVNDLGLDLAAAGESERHAWEVDENRDARLADLQRSVDAVRALADEWRDFGDATLYMDDAAADITQALDGAS